MGELRRLSLDRHLSGGSELARPEVVIEETRRVRLEEEVNLRFTPDERTFREMLKVRLSPQQASAVDLMVEGACDAEVARVLGVHRSTVSRWRQFHPAFIAELNRRRDGTLDAAADQLRQTTRRAMAIIRERLDATDRPDLQLRAAIGLLRMLGVGTRAAQVGPTSADQFIDDQVHAARRQKREFIDNGEREAVVLDLARRDDGARVDDAIEPQAEARA